jgi:hypothetical protein
MTMQRKDYQAHVVAYHTAMINRELASIKLSTDQPKLITRYRNKAASARLWNSYVKNLSRLFAINK